jgi:hypothetical protein
MDEIKPLKLERPSTEFMDFRDRLLREICTQKKLAHGCSRTPANFHFPTSVPDNNPETGSSSRS